MRNRLMGTSL